MKWARDAERALADRGRGVLRSLIPGRGAPPLKAIYHTPVTSLSRLVCRLAPVVALCVTSGIVQAQPHTVATPPRTSRVVLVDSVAFNHSRHLKLFPTCTGCHVNVTSQDTRDLFPSARSCAECHNGTDVERVNWAPPARPRPQGLLRFSHRTHFARSDSAGNACATCHAGSPSAPFMAVGVATAERCQTCHEHRASAHYAPDNTCRSCHVPLVDAASLTARDIAGLPQPASHRARNFAAEHAPVGVAAVAQCATCHARESCARCHLNSASQPLIAALGRDPRVAGLVRGRAAVYPTPNSHRRDEFVNGHGPLASAAGATCATCHARSSCTTCHTGRGAAAVIRALPEGTTETPGVQLVRLASLVRSNRTQLRVASTPDVDTTRYRVRPHPDRFIDNHRLGANASRQTCEGCHTRRFCSDCHAGENRRVFHPANFAVTHSADTYTRDRDCASCHNTEVFCRDCHRANGLGAQGRNAAVYHNAQPQWLLQHGRAARQELTTCTTCHTQSTCMRCHATTGWGVNPHGADFDAGRLGRKAMAMCARCHITDPRRR